jgi:hypothetical protein
MWNIFISFVSGSAFLGGMASILVLYMALRQKPDKSEVLKQHEELIEMWKQRNTLYAEQNVQLERIADILMRGVNGSC